MSDLWSVNTDQEYHEAISEKTPHDVEELAGTLEGAIARVFPKLDPVAFGLSLGLAAGTLLLIATLVLVLKGGDLGGSESPVAQPIFPWLQRDHYRKLFWTSLRPCIGVHWWLEFRPYEECGNVHGHGTHPS